MRNIVDVTIHDEGRDKSKVFRITEMPASKAEEWALKAIMALTKAGVDVPAGSGMAGIASVGLQALGTLNFPDVKSLLDEMFSCVARLPDPHNLSLVRPLVEDDTEEVATRLRLRAEVFTLHTGFSFAGAPSTTSSSGTPAATQRSRHRKTSRRQSRPLSPHG